MLYAILCEDAPASLAGREAHRPAHRGRLKALLEQGRLVLAGPHPALDCEDPGQAGFTGSLIVAEFDSWEAAQAWAQADPYVQTGVFTRVTVKPFRQILP